MQSINKQILAILAQVKPFSPVSPAIHLPGQEEIAGLSH